MSNFTDFIGGSSEIITRTLSGTDVTIDGDALYQYWNLTGSSTWDIGTWEEGETVNLYVRTNGNTLENPISASQDVNPFGDSRSDNDGSMTYPTADVGDVVFCFVASDTTTNEVTTAGWTSTGQTFDYSGFYSSLWYKVIDGTEGSTIDFNADVAVAFVYKGEVSDISGFTTATGTSGDPNPPSVSATDGNYILVFGLQADDGAVMAYGGDFTVLGSEAFTGAVSLIVAYANVTTTGTYDPVAFGGDGSDTWLAGTLEVPSLPVQTVEWFNGNVPTLSSTQTSLLEITKVRSDYYGKLIGYFD